LVGPATARYSTPKALADLWRTYEADRRSALGDQLIVIRTALSGDKSEFNELLSKLYDDEGADK
jgi:hypothetical protein